MRVLAATLALIAVAACGQRSGDPVAAAIAADLARELGEPIASVRCRDRACVATTGHGVAIPVTVTATRPATWTTEELLDPRPIRAEVLAALATVGVTTTVDCGPTRLAATVGPRLSCALGTGGEALVAIDDDGGIDVELALTAATAAARHDGPDDDTLEQASLALDTDDAEGSDDESAEADAGTDGDGGLGVDAGVRGAGG